MQPSTRTAITRHAKAEYPKECCGIIADGVYHPCDNIAADPYNHFEMDGDFVFEMMQINDGNLIIVHSHPDGTPNLSEMDKIQMNYHGLDWVVVGVQKDPVTGKLTTQTAYHAYQEYRPPLLGRDYIPLWQDCYTLVQDYYLRELGIALPDFDRTDGWWEDDNHAPLYETNLEKAGFVIVQGTPQKHDMIICRVGRTQHANHALIYLGDGVLKSETTPQVVGDNLFIHHPHSALSCREIYGENWQRRTVLVARHKELIQ